MGRRDRGFFSIDAFFALTLLLMISASFMNIYEGRRQGVELMGAKLEAKIIGEKLAATMNTVYANGSNFELSVGLPSKIGNHFYEIRFDNTTRQISVEGAYGSVHVVVVCKNVKNFVLGPENLGKTIRIYWIENTLRVVSS